MNPGPYTNGYLPVSRAADAIRNQADTMLDELHGSIDRAKAFRAKLKQRAAEDSKEDFAEYDRACARLRKIAPMYSRPVRIVPFHYMWSF